MGIVVSDMEMGSRANPCCRTNPKQRALRCNRSPGDGPDEEVRRGEEAHGDTIPCLVLRRRCRLAASRGLRCPQHLQAQPDVAAD